MTLEAAKLIGKQYLNPHIIECEIECMTAVAAHPGQYILLQIDEVWRPFSVAEVRHGTVLVLVVQPIDNTLTARYFASLKVGNSVMIQEPRGDVSLPDKTDVLLIATGTGMVPLYTVASHLLGAGYTHKIDIIFGTQTEDKLFYLEKLEELEARYSNCNVTITVSRSHSGWRGVHGRAIDYVKSHINQYRGHDYILCGRRETVAAQIKQLEELGISDTKIQFIE